MAFEASTLCASQASTIHTISHEPCPTLICRQLVVESLISTSSAAHRIQPSRRFSTWVFFKHAGRSIKRETRLERAISSQASIFEWTKSIAVFGPWIPKHLYLGLDLRSVAIEQVEAARRYQSWIYIRVHVVDGKDQTCPVEPPATLRNVEAKQSPPNQQVHAGAKSLIAIALILSSCFLIFSQVFKAFQPRRPVFQTSQPNSVSCAHPPLNILSYQYLRISLS